MLSEKIADIRANYNAHHFPIYNEIDEIDANSVNVITYEKYVFVKQLEKINELGLFDISITKNKSVIDFNLLKDIAAN